MADIAEQVDTADRRRRWRWLAGIGALILVIGAVWWVNAGDDTSDQGHVTALHVGDCFDVTELDPETGAVRSIEKKDCSQPHHYETFAEWSGSVTRTDGACTSLLPGYVGDVSSLPNELQIMSMIFWFGFDGTDHVLCALGTPSGTLTESFRRAG